MHACLHGVRRVLRETSSAHAQAIPACILEGVKKPAHGRGAMIQQGADACALQGVPWHGTEAQRHALPGRMTPSAH